MSDKQAFLRRYRWPAIGLIAIAWLAGVTLARRGSGPRTPTAKGARELLQIGALPVT
jgi:hypothetical protein